MKGQTSQVIEPEKKPWQLTEFPVTLRKRLKKAAVERDVNLSGLLEDIVLEWLEKNAK